MLQDFLHRKYKRNLTRRDTRITP